MDGIGNLLSLLNENLPDIPSKVFQDYRLWVCRNFDKLLKGDKDFWRLFQKCRSRFIEQSGLPGDRFAWEGPFVREPFQNKTFFRTTLCKRVGMSPATLRSYEKADLLPSPASSFYEKPSIKRLQWILFFRKELGFRVPELAALLSIQPIRSQLDDLVCSAEPSLPVHLSPPVNKEKKSMRYGRECPSTDSQANVELLHDMGNRLHIIAGRANLLRRKMVGNDVAERNLTIILSQSKRADKILNALRKTKDSPS